MPEYKMIFEVRHIEGIEVKADDELSARSLANSILMKKYPDAVGYHLKSLEIKEETFEPK